MAKMVRDGDAEDVAERQQMVVARITVVRAEPQAAMREAGVSESDLDAVRAEKETQQRRTEWRWRTRGWRLSCAHVGGRSAKPATGSVTGAKR